MGERVPAAVSLGMALLLILAGAVIACVVRRAADGRLPRNQVAGIRLRATLRSDAAWRAGHAAARSPSDAAAGSFATAGFAAAVVRDAVVLAAAVLAGCLAAFVFLGFAARRATRAADAARL